MAFVASIVYLAFGRPRTPRHSDRRQPRRTCLQPALMVSRADSRQRVENGLILRPWAFGPPRLPVVPGPPVKLAIAAPPAAAALLWWITSAPERWVAIFLLSAILLPPLPAPVGNAGVHIAPFFALAGILTGILRMNEWRTWRGSLPTVFGAFLAAVIGSVAFAALYSGWTIAAGARTRDAVRHRPLRVLLPGRGRAMRFRIRWAPIHCDWRDGSSLRAPRRLFLRVSTSIFSGRRPQATARSSSGSVKTCCGVPRDFSTKRARSATSVPSSL